MFRTILFLMSLVVVAIALPASRNSDLLPGALPASKSPAIPFRDFGGRIISGSQASRGQFPWQAALYLTLSGGTSFCGGALISPSWILTAAHCVEGVRSITIYLGVVSLSDTAGRVTATANRIVAHPNYSSSTLQNDIALIQLSTSVATSSTVRTIPLASSTLGSGVAVSVSGFGRTSDSSSSISQNLLYVPLTTITNAVCQQTFGNIIQSGIVCARGSTTQSTCNGDSGGPMVTGSGTNAVHVAVVSFVSSAGCGRGYPSGYTRTAAYRSWISANAGV